MNMRRSFLFLLVWVFGLSVTFGAIKIPSSVFKMSELSEAVAKANDKKKALTFVFTDEGST